MALLQKYDHVAGLLRDLGNAVVSLVSRVTSLEDGVDGNYLGGWNASTNTPALAAGVGAPNKWYQVTVAGTQSITGTSVAFAVGDTVRFSANGNKWVRVPYGGGGVASVNGKTGAAVLTAADVGAAPSTAPTISGQAIFTGTPLLSSTNPRLDFKDTDAPSGAQYGSLNIANGAASIQKRGDDGAFVSNLLVIDLATGRATMLPVFGTDLTFAAGAGERRLRFEMDVLTAGLYGNNNGEFGAIDYTNSRYIYRYVAAANTIKFAPNLILSPAASVTPAENGEMMVQLTSNTQLAFKVRGSDGVVRSATLTLA